MNEPDNRRRFARANVGDDHTVRFMMGETSLTGLVMTNLSAGGCCVKVPASLAETLEKGTSVESVYLVHPRIPSVPLAASVCWLLGKQPGRTEGFVLVGLEFTDPNPEYQGTLDAYVQELLG